MTGKNLIWPVIVVSDPKTNIYYISNYLICLFLIYFSKIISCLIPDQTFFFFSLGEKKMSYITCILLQWCIQTKLVKTKSNFKF